MNIVRQENRNVPATNPAISVNAVRQGRILIRTRSGCRHAAGGVSGNRNDRPERVAAPRRRPDRRNGNGGFTLLEVLIAFAMASIALAVLYHGTTDGLLGSRLAARTDEAVARARSRLAVLCHGAPLMPGEQSGDDGGGYTWRTQIHRAAAQTVARGIAEPRSGCTGPLEPPIMLRARHAGNSRPAP